MFHSKKNTLIIMVLILLGVISTSLLFFFSDLMLFLFVLLGFYISFNTKKPIETCMYLSLGIVSTLPKLEGLLFDSGFLPSLVFVSSYIILCISGVLFVVKLFRKIKEGTTKEKRYY